MIEQDFQPGTVVTLNDNKGQVAEYHIGKIRQDPADAMLEAEHPQPRDIEQVVDQFRDAGFPDHCADCFR